MKPQYLIRRGYLVAEECAANFNRVPHLRENANEVLPLDYPLGVLAVLEEMGAYEEIVELLLHGLLSKVAGKNTDP